MISLEPTELSTSDFKFTANEKRLQIYASFSKADAVKHDSVPEEVLDKAVTHIEKWRDQKKLLTFRFYEDELNKFWKMIISERCKKIKDEAKFKMLIGSGSPELPGFTVESAGDKLAAAKVSFSAPKDVIANWNTEFLKVEINNFLER